MEMTTDEIVEAMRGIELPDKAAMDLTAILRDGDLVKFAKDTPDAEQNEADYLKPTTSSRRRNLPKKFRRPIPTKR